MSNRKGNIVILNGVSSSGKTTVAKALQAELDEHYFWVANDTFCDMCSSKHWDKDWVTASNQALRALNYSVQAFSDAGLNVTVDHVFLNDGTQERLLDECVEILHGYPVLFVRVDCSLEELERREKERSDRDVGQARGQLQYVHNHEIYDCVVDTSKMPTQRIVKLIRDAIKGGRQKDAFERLYQRLQQCGTVYIVGKKEMLGMVHRVDF